MLKAMITALVLLIATGCDWGGEKSDQSLAAAPLESPSSKGLAVQQENLWTRTKGVDWPTFLGPTGDGKSSETGILTDWSGGKLRVLLAISNR